MIKFSSLDLRSRAFSTSSSTTVARESECGRTVTQVSAPSRTTTPLSTSSPTETKRGIDSPVSDDVSSPDEPEIMRESIGILSPGRTRIVVPTSTSSASSSISSPSTITRAVSGQISSNSLMDFLLRLTALCSKNSPIRKNIITATPSVASPMINAPTEARDIKNFSSKRSPLRIPFTAPKNTEKPDMTSAKSSKASDK